MFNGNGDLLGFSISNAQYLGGRGGFKPPPPGCDG